VLRHTLARGNITAARSATHIMKVTQTGTKR
jgi:hypothetical protein